MAELRHLFTRYRSGPRIEVGEIDVVYLWSDPGDVEWAQRRREVLEAEVDADLCRINLQAAPSSCPLDELRYSLRSVEKYLSGVRHVYLVVDKQRPDWLDIDHPKLKVVEVEDIVSDPAHYPSYNTQAIESYFYNIEGLSERFIYFNDDFFLKKPIGVESFFTRDGRLRVRLGRALAPRGTPGPGDEGDAAGHMNANKALDQNFGRRTRLTVMHRPYAHNTALLAFAAERFADEFAQTRSSRFRSARMLAIHSFLVPYAAYEAGSADLVPPHLLEKDMFRWTTDAASNAATMKRIRRGPGTAFCIQEARGVDIDEDSARGFGEFMHSLYPEPCRFERAEADSTQ